MDGQLQDNEKGQARKCFHFKTTTVIHPAAAVETAASSVCCKKDLKSQGRLKGDDTNLEFIDSTFSLAITSTHQQS